MAFGTLIVSIDCLARPPMLVSHTNIIQKAANPHIIAVSHISLVTNVKFSQIGRELLFSLGVCCFLYYFLSKMPKIQSHTVRRFVGR